MPSIAPLTEPLRTATVEVRDAAERDIPEVLIAYQDDPQLHLRLGEERPPSGAELGRRAEAEARNRATGVRAALTITEANDVCRGQIYVYDLDWEHHRAALAIWVAPRERRRGLATAALKLVAPWLLGQGLLRLQILAEPDNAPMLATARAAGFLPEGVLRAHTRRADRRVDAAVLSMLPGDLRP